MFRDKKGFFSVDAFFALLLLLTVSAMLLNAAQTSNQVASQTSATQKADLIVEKFAGAINSVYANGQASELRIDLIDNIELIEGNYVLNQDNNYKVSLDLDERVIFIENHKKVSSDVAKAPIIPQNIHDFELSPENLSRTIRIYWDNENIRVINCE
ncbi:MAG: hypothetical protein KGY45_05005 [Hadesarchaea archaeon]|nr:hypothetical protein [Hadesarchaea archaeon]